MQPAMLVNLCYVSQGMVVRIWVMWPWLRPF